MCREFQGQRNTLNYTRDESSATSTQWATLQVKQSRFSTRSMYKKVREVGETSRFKETYKPYQLYKVDKTLFMSREVYLTDKTMKFSDVITIKVRRLLEESWAGLG